MKDQNSTIGKEEEILTFGERISDKISTFGGSWSFILSFLGFLFLWMLINSVQYFWKPFDPYPFILLNLILSTIAALQAPVIMMSQRRVEERDRKRSMQDLDIDMKAEKDIRQLKKQLSNVEKVILEIRDELKNK
jgi:uncharacterized membrane protein